MTKLVFPVNVENVLLCFAEKDAETKRLQAERDELFAANGEVAGLVAELQAENERLKGIIQFMDAANGH